MDKMKFETPDTAQMNAEKITALFPNCMMGNLIDCFVKNIPVSAIEERRHIVAEFCMENHNEQNQTLIQMQTHLLSKMGA